MSEVVADARCARGRHAGIGVVALLMVAAAAHAASPGKFLDGKLSWRSIGPYIGGRVVAVAGVTGRRKLFYMGAVDGGVWESTDYGVSWRNITDGKWSSASESVGAIAVAPSNAKVIYAGTGEADIRNDMVAGDGVFKSIDGGKAWSYSGLRDTRTISSIVVDPHDPDVVYVASMGHVFAPNADRGVFKSTDGGATWHKILFVDSGTGAIDLVMSPGNPDVLYAAMWQARRTPWSLDDGGPGSGLYESGDGGAHWTNISRSPGLPRGLLGRIGVAVAASDPEVVYAIVQAKDGGIFRSTDGGAHWRRVNAGWSLRQRGFYYMAIYVDPTNPQSVYVPQVDGVWVSHNGGGAFSLLHMRHWDNHALWIDPEDPSVLLVGNDGGATVSTDGGRTWSTEYNQPTGQFYHVAIDHQFPFHVYGAQQDEGSLEGPSAMPGGAIPTGVWHTVALGESAFVAPDPGDAHRTYGSDYYTIMQDYDGVSGAQRGVSPEPVYLDGVSSAEMKYRFGWSHPIFFSPNDPHALFLASQYVMKSEDCGRDWKIISPDLTRNDPATERPSGGPVELDQTGAEVFPYVSALAVSTVDSGVIWAGSADGLVHVTIDGGRDWRLVTPPKLTQWAQITSIEPSHVSVGTAYMTASRYMWDDYRPFVFRTMDFGRHWVRLTNGLPADEYAFVVRQDPADPSLLFLGTADTVYMSLDGGAHWHPLGLNLPRAQVRDIAIDTREGEVVAATHGRAFWILDNLALLEQLSHEGLPDADSTALYPPQRVWLTSAYGRSELMSQIYGGAVGTNPPFGATVLFHIPAAYDGKTPVSLEFLDDHGAVIRRFELHLKKKQPSLPPTVADNLPPSRARRIAEESLTGISPGMNSLLWNLRYADATDVIGFEPPEDTDGLTASASGPGINPGSYGVVLEYGRQSYRQTLQVALDPRLRATPAGLKEHLAVELELHHALSVLDRTIDAAITIRQRLARAAAAGKIEASTAAPVLATLKRTIDGLVQLDIHSSEGDAMHQVRLRGYLAYLQSDIGLDYEQPNTAEAAAVKKLMSDARQGEARLGVAMTAGERLLQSTGGAMQDGRTVADPGPRTPGLSAISVAR